MDNVLIVKIDDLYWYCTGGLTVNATYDDVTVYNTESVKDCDTFTMDKKITTNDELEYEVMEVLASEKRSKLQDEIEDLEINDIQLGKDVAKDIVKNLFKNACTDDFKIIYYYEFIFIDDNNNINIRGSGKFLEVDTNGDIV